tara:strand:- start:46106 stop:48385 length:2280 start_codon:yes stop_codon:yes gene_type:complete
MFNDSVLLKTLPELWQNSFEDKSIIKSLYRVLGDLVSDNYKDVTKELASLSLDYTEENNLSTWQALEISLGEKLELISPDGTSFITIYPIENTDPYLISCARIYPSCTLETDVYLETGKDYEILFKDSDSIRAINARFKREHYFSKHEYFLVLKNNDPLVEGTWQKEPVITTTEFTVGFTIAESSLTANDVSALADDKVVDIEVEGASFRANIYTKVLVQGTYEILLEPSSTSNLLDGLATITLSTGTSFRTKIDRSAPIENTISRLWAYSSSVDHLELFKRFGWLLDLNSSILSTRNYKNILSEFRRSSLKGLSKKSLEKLISFLLQGDTVVNSFDEDNIVFLNLVTSVLRTNLEEYPVNSSAYFSELIVSSTPKVITKFGSFLKENTFYLTIPLYKDLIHSSIASGKVVELRSTSAKLGNLVLSTSSGKFLGVKESTYSSNLSSCVIRVAGSDIVLPNNTLFTQEELPSSPGYLEDELINTFVSIKDIGDGDNWWHNEGLVIPNSVWKVDSESRSRVTLDTWEFTIGSMPKHRIGDYALAIPTASGTVTNDTSYKLMRDFLSNKATSISYLQTSIRNTDISLGQCVDILEPLISLSNLLFLTNINPLVEYVELPTESVGMVVTTTPSSLPEQINSAQNTGIGNSDILAYITLQNSSHGVTTGTSSISISGESATCLAVAGATLVLSLGSTGISSALNLTMLQVGSSSFIIQSGFLTNVIGANQPSRAMVVGNSYPEYPRYFPIGSSTISQNLFIEVI